MNLSYANLNCTEIRVLKRVGKWVAVDFKLHLVVEGVSANPGNEFSSVLSVSFCGDRQNFARKPDQYQVPSATGFFRTIQGMEDRKQIAFCQGFARRFRIFNENHCEVQSCSARSRFGPKGHVVESAIRSLQSYNAILNMLRYGLGGQASWTLWS